MAPSTETIPPLVSPLNSAVLQHDLDNLTQVANNDTDDERNERLAEIEVAISATILVLAVVGNSIVVVSLMIKRGKLSRMHLMMLHLSLADLSVAFFQVLPQMVWDITFRFQGGAFLCGAVKYVQLVTMYASAYVLLSTAVDRYVAICKPFLSHKWTSRHAHLLVLTAWLASLVFSLPQVFIFSLSELGEGTGVYDCWANFDPPWTLKLYVAWNVLSVFIAPSLTLAALYGHITYAVWKSSKMAENQAPRYTPQSTVTTTAHHYTPLHSVATGHNKQAWNSGGPAVAGNGAAPFEGGAGLGVGNDQEFPSGGGSHATTIDCRNGGHDAARSIPTGSVRSGVAGKGQDGADKTKSAAADRRKTSEDRNPNFSSSSADVTSSSRLVSVSSSGHVTASRAARGAGVGISRAKIKTIKLTLTVVICYLVCWTPFYVAQLWAAYGDNVPYESIFFTLVLLLASVNSCTNPWIYMAFSDTIWNSLRAIVLSLVCCNRAASAGGDGRYAYTQTAAYRASTASASTLRSNAANGVSSL